MAATMKIDQAGLSAGTAGRSRDDGLSTGALVTLTSTGHVSTFRFRLLWVGQHPNPDTTSVVSLTQASATTYTFLPTAGVFGTWRIELVTDEGSIYEDREIRTFAIKQSAQAVRIPAANERSDPSASLTNSDSSFVDSSENNKIESSGAFASGTYVSYWKALADAIYNVNVYAISGSALTGSAGGDLTGSYPNPTVVKIRGVTVSSTAPSLGQVLGYNGSQWIPVTTSSSGGGSGGSLQSGYNSGSSIVLDDTHNSIKIDDSNLDTDYPLLALTKSFAAGTRPAMTFFHTNSNTSNSIEITRDTRTILFGPEGITFTDDNFSQIFYIKSSGSNGNLGMGVSIIGQDSLTSYGGPIQLIGGNGDYGGQISLFGGEAATGFGGSISIVAGDALANQGGELNLVAGSGATRGGTLKLAAGGLYPSVNTRSLDGFIRIVLTEQQYPSRLIFEDITTNNYVGFVAPDIVSSSVVWTLPGQDGTNGQVLTTNGNGYLSFTSASGGGTSDIVTNLSSVSGSSVTTALNNLATRLDFENINTSSYTFALTDVGKKKRFLATCTASLPGTGTVAWVTGSVIYGRQVNAGSAGVFITGSGGTVINQSVFKTTTQHSEFVLHYVGNNTWDLSGDLTS